MPWLRLISMEQGVEVDPHVFAAAQMLAGLEAEQTSPFIFFLESLPTRKPLKKSGKAKAEQIIVILREVFI